MEEGRKEHLRDLESNLSDLQQYLRGQSDYRHEHGQKGQLDERAADEEPQELGYDRVSFGGGSGRTALTDPRKSNSNGNRFEDIEPSRFKRDLRSQLHDDVLQYSNTERPSSAARGLATSGHSQMVGLFREYEEMLQQIEGVYAEREHRLESRIAELEAELQSQQQVSARANPENPPPEVEYLTKTLQRERAERRERENNTRTPIN